MRSPYDLIVKGLQQDLPEGMLKFLPKKWEKIGDVLIIRLSVDLHPYSHHIGATYAEVLHCATVLEETGGIAGDFRIPQRRVIFGKKNHETMHKENGITYQLMPEKIMFSSGNIDERKRMANIANSDEIVVDLFAGIGYFTIPLAVYSQPRHIYACEKNPISFHYLKNNVQLNSVQMRVTPLFGDNRSSAPKDIADRVIMGFFGDTKQFISTALSCLKDQKGIIHYHDTYPEEKMPENAISDVKKEVRAFKRSATLLNCIAVKSFAPGISHYVCDFRIEDV